MNKVNLLGLSRSSLENFLLMLDEKPFRARQIIQWIYQKGITDLNLMTDLSKTSRSKVLTVAQIRMPEVSFHGKSLDGTQKWLIKLDDGSQIETVYIPEDHRGTLCVSSQVGCSFDCSFCATGKQGFARNLDSGEIIAQVFIAARFLRASLASGKKRSITNVVFMGMGEPLMNFDAVIETINIIVDDLAYGLSKRKVTVSTSGVVPEIYRLAKCSDVSLAVSLHSAFDNIRDRLVPLNRKYPIDRLLRAVKSYQASLSSHRSVTFEYTMLQDINDSDNDADALAAIASDIRCKVNLIPFNQFFGTEFKSSSTNRINAFQRRLSGRGILSTIRRTRGEDINAACGQLSGMFKDKTFRRKRYSQKYETIKLASILE